MNRQTIATAVLVAILMPGAWASELYDTIERAPAALQLRLDKLGSSATAPQARAQCWIDLARAERSQSLIHSNATPAKALYNADQLIGALERGDKTAESAQSVRIYDRKVYPASDSRYGRPQWLADIQSIERTIAAYQEKRCVTPVSACLDVTYESVMENMQETEGARWNHGRPEIDHALKLVSQAQDDLATCPHEVPPIAALVKATPARIDKTLNADALFDFDKATIKPAGKAALRQFAAQLEALGTVSTVTVTGYTDRFGSAARNRALSQRRADAVKQFLFSTGVKVPVHAIGAGNTDSVVQCPGPRSAKTIACLQPNRRAALTVTGQAQD